MILHGNQRGGGKDLALHLMKEENEHVEVHELRGFVADDLVGAFKESYAISKATRCKQHLFSLSINPPKSADISDDDFTDAVALVEKKLGLEGQPRAIVFHHKRGMDGELRRHVHAVWCRIDPETMTAVPLPFTKLKLRDVSRDLHIKHDLTMPRGLINSSERDPRNFTLAEWQQCKRAGKNAAKVKSVFQDCWAISDSKTAFAHALEEQGYILAKGKRGHVAVDYQGEVYAVSRYVGVKAKQVRAKLGDSGSLPSVDAAHAKAARQVTDRLEQLRADQETLAFENQRRARERQENLEIAHAGAKDMLRSLQTERRQAEEQVRTTRIRNGLFGLWDRLTGRRRRTEEQNRRETALAELCDREEAKALTRKHADIRKAHRDRARGTLTPHGDAIRELRADIERLRAPPASALTRANESSAASRTNRTRRPRRRRSRSGPSPSH